MRPRNPDTFSGFLIREFAVIATFFCGMWVVIGVAPSDFPIKLIADFILEVMQNPSWGMFFWAIPIPVLILAIITAIAYGGLFDLVGLALAFAGGYYIGSPVGIILLILGLLVGLIAPVSTS